MLASLTASQLDQWFWFSQLEPIGFPAQDFFASRQLAATYNVTGGFKPLLKSEDFLLHPPNENTNNSQKNWQDLKASMSAAIKKDG